MTMTILVILLVLIVLGLPQWPYARDASGAPIFGYGPSGLLTVVLVIVLIWLLLGRHA